MMGLILPLCSLSYTSVDWARRMVLGTERGALLAIDNAYRMIPVHPNDCHLLGMNWNYELDSTLSFGFRSAPKVFNVVVDCQQCIFSQHGAMHGHSLFR